MENDRINYQRIFLLAGTFALLIYYLFQWVQMISDPVLRTSLDFLAYYSAARIAEQDGPAQAYDVSFLHSTQEQVVGYKMSNEQVMPFLHMPYLLPLLGVVIDEKYSLSFLRWDLFLIVVYVIAFLVLSKWFPPDRTPLQRRSFLYGAVTFFPCFISLLLGQDTALLLLAVVLLGWGLASEKDWLAGVGLALLTVRPHILVLMVLPVFILYRRVFWKFLLISIPLAALSFVLIGTQGAGNFLDVMALASKGRGYGLSVETMMNLQGLLVRHFSFLGLDTIRAASWVVYLLGIPALCLLAARARKIDIQTLGQMMLVCVFIVPHLHYHDLTLLLFPLLSVNIAAESNPFYLGLQKLLHPMVVSLLFLFGLVQVTLLPSLVIFLLFMFLFRSRYLHLADAWVTRPALD